MNSQNPFAVIALAGRQFKVRQGSRIVVEKLAASVGDQITVSDVLMTGSESSSNFGTPMVSGASVVAKVLGHYRGEKLIVYKKRRRKGYTKKQGHRQALTELQIENISF